ncbi:hypothetical protein BD410DRAFT_834156 [Rickenella mellea]|uniref:CCD97-like C-terminal domain-containing protein n=1 Tax=Rickenella mellea TaxID=50990 RepID=A0A4R5XHK3_9AGAM|nr:hypothetical protein BD410DRAFT_834156 [Rickenella mellea]
MPVEDNRILTYLQLPADYQPSPSTNPVEFLNAHLRNLPLSLLLLFSTELTPKQRTTIPTIRNRRLRYTQSSPPPLAFSNARNMWPNLYTGHDRPSRPSQDDAKDERQWAEKEFLAGTKQHVGKLGALLGDYEEERGAERARDMRRQQAEAEFVPEEESDEESEGDKGDVSVQQESPEEAKEIFERRINERFIYGLLDNIDYDAVDWDDQWDEQNYRDEEDSWFDEEDEE